MLRSAYLMKTRNVLYTGCVVHNSRLVRPAGHQGEAVSSKHSWFDALVVVSK